MAKKKKKKFNIKDPNVICLIVSAFVLLAAGYSWYDMVYVPIKESIDELEAREETLSAELMRINALKPQLENLRREAAVREAKLDSLKNIFPDSKEVPRLIKDITDVNLKSAVVTTRFTPKPDVAKEYYIENKYDVAVTGSYHNLGKLFSLFANLQLIVNLSNVSITANPGYVTGGVTRGTGEGAFRVESTPSVNATFELTTFSSKR